ncbi:plantaricin C family lantibiotic [Staphylococcus agnetis]|uniref:plantaricin C family lantibiotic n=1 Tax=Staphylococcus agnetis TaxID=985762 RepID=UPI00208FF03D|nr:plantaricin C family lantibiotic [Staphylococcus agnetis]MCO4346591.1 plantaricin C family lantibiotic [Staphylococcus agnetis]
MNDSQIETFKCAGDLLQELQDGNFDYYLSGSSEIRKKKSFSEKTGNDGEHCTITWECSICPTHTCWC